MRHRVLLAIGVVALAATLTAPAAAGPVSCFPTILGIRCAGLMQWVPTAPNARVIHVDPAEGTSLSDDRKAAWEARCQPRVVQGPDGLNRMVYAQGSCEFGP